MTMHVVVLPSGATISPTNISHISTGFSNSQYLDTMAISWGYEWGIGSKFIPRQWGCARVRKDNEKIWSLEYIGSYCYYPGCKITIPNHRRHDASSSKPEFLRFLLDSVLQHSGEYNPLTLWIFKTVSLSLIIISVARACSLTNSPLRCLNWWLTNQLSSDATLIMKAIVGWHMTKDFDEKRHMKSAWTGQS